MPVTESAFTLDEARKVLAREACEFDLDPPLTAANPYGMVMRRPKRMDPLPLGHDLAKVYDCGFKGYRCLRCGAFFAEVVTGEQHQLPVGEPAS